MKSVLCYLCLLLFKFLCPAVEHQAPDGFFFEPFNREPAHMTGSTAKTATSIHAGTTIVVSVPPPGLSDSGSAA